MDIFDKDKKLVVIYLSKAGCLDYTKAIIKGFKKLDPLLVITPRNKTVFANYNHKLFATYDTLFHALIHSLRIRSRVHKLLNELQQEHGALELYFPAFHPWNTHFINWTKKNPACKTTVTIHDFITHKGEKSAFTEKLQCQAIGAAYRVVTLTNYVKNQITTNLGPSDKYLVIPHPLLPTEAKNNLPHSTNLKLLFLGRVVEYKGVDILITAAKDLDLELTIAGRQKDSKIKSAGKIKVIDTVLTDSTISDLLNSHHILVLPYLEASQSGIIPLAVTAEMVMIISKVGGLSEQLPADSAVWVAPSIASLKEGIELLIKDSNIYDAIKQSVRGYKAQRIKEISK